MNKLKYKVSDFKWHLWIGKCLKESNFQKFINLKGNQFMCNKPSNNSQIQTI